jgi:hypothetical protein
MQSELSRFRSREESYHLCTAVLLLAIKRNKDVF